MTPHDVAAVTRELEAIEQELALTWKNGDCEGWAGLIAPEWSVTHITGDVVTKAQALAMCRESHHVIAEMTIDDVSVRPYGDAAVVTGRTVAVTAGDTPETVRLRFTDVFVRRAGRWQVVASHATRVAGDQDASKA
jgi:hypothetical protein